MAFLKPVKSLTKLLVRERMFTRILISEGMVNQVNTQATLWHSYIMSVENCWTFTGCRAERITF